jgi:hypothetical protein
VPKEKEKYSLQSCSAQVGNTYPEHEYLKRISPENLFFIILPINRRLLVTEKCEIACPQTSYVVN